MQRIGDSTSTANASGEFTEGSADGGIRATQIKAAWLNSIQRELLSVIEKAGLSRDVTDDSQLLQAVQIIATWAAQFDHIGNKPTTLEGYGITDALKRGELGLGASSILTGTVDHIGLPGGLYAFGEGPTSFVNYSALINLPYIDERYGAQLGLVFGGAGSEPRLAFRVTTGPNSWGPTRFGWHDGNFNPSSKADKSSTYTTTQVDGFLSKKANTAFSLGGYGITDAYTITQVDNLLSGKAAKASTLAGYGITDAYTSTQVDAIAARKANNAISLGGYGITDAYTITQVDNLLSGKAAKASTLAGYGITDALKRGDSGLGVNLLTGASSVDSAALLSGFHAMGDGATSLLGYSSVLHMPYVLGGYAGQIAMSQGRAEVEIRVRSCVSPNVWTPTRRLMHDGHQATVDQTLQGTDDNTWLSPFKLVTKLVDGFAVSLAQNGYIVLPKWLGGVVFQWGRANNIPPGAASVSLNIAMPRAIFTAVASAIGNVNGSQHEVVEVAEISNTKITVSNSGTGSVSWFAIGY